MTVGIPALALAYWARPSRAGFDAVRRILSLVIPPAIVLAALGLPLYAWASQTLTLAEARTTFTTFAVICGLLLLPLLHPPIAFSFTSSRPTDAPRPDIRPTVLALVMLAAYDLCFIIEPIRDFFELAQLSAGVVALTGIAAIAWAVITVVLWRTDAYTRVLGVVARVRGTTEPQPAA